MTAFDNSGAEVEVTRLLGAIQRGDRAAESRLIQLVGADLQRIARARFVDLKPGQTLTPTDLAHDAYLRLVRRRAPWENRRHFFAAASRAMRSILVNEARRKKRLKRGGMWQKVELQDPIAPADVSSTDSEVYYLALDEALSQLEKLHKTQHEVVILKYFGGLTVDEIACCLGVSASTVERQWRFARAWLLEKLT